MKQTVSQRPSPSLFEHFGSPKRENPLGHPLPTEFQQALQAASTRVRQRFAALSKRRSLFEALGFSGATPLPDPPHALERRDAVLTLVQRITQGFQLAEYQHAKELGYDAYLEQQLDHTAIDDTDSDARVAAFPTISMSPREIYTTFFEDSSIPFWELKQATLVRSVHSRRQLYERMCEFWSNHFSIEHQKDAEYAFKPEDDINVVRSHALGFFPDMLRASAHSAAMLYYLDNWLNFIGTPQENYSRELMELHTLDVHGGFTEMDVREVAKCLTGWTLNLDSNDPDYLRTKWEDAFHEPGARTVLGVPVPNAPRRQQLNAVIDILAAHPSTAQFISAKMTRWLLRENPPQGLVDQVAQTYLSTGGDIKAMIRVILDRDNLKWSSTVFQPKFKRPFHLVTSLLRGLNLELNDALYTNYYLYYMGHSPFDWHPPNGYPDSVGVWGRSLLPRWTFISALMGQVIPGVNGILQIPTFLEFSGPNPHVGLARRINERALGMSLPPKQEAAIQEFIDSLAPLSGVELFEAIALAASAPGYQWY